MGILEHCGINDKKYLQGLISNIYKKTENLPIQIDYSDLGDVLRKQYSSSNQGNNPYIELVQYITNHSRYLEAMAMRQQQTDYRKSKSSDKVIEQLSLSYGQKLPEAQFMYVLDILKSLLSDGNIIGSHGFKTEFEKMTKVLKGLATGNSSVKDEAIFLIATLPLSSTKFTQHYNRGLHAQAGENFKLLATLGARDREAALLFIKEPY
ncbi:hypothetical protein NOX90_02260 [Wolbachia endosymbiont of Anurida maritima]|uniref:hypothetical protein n=1 Tax=Wolbachia endosymbiont of Anurida maritima TaxID=2850562 RepID=UPI0035CF5E46